MPEKPIIVFDTSALNKLAKEADALPLAAGLRAGYRVCLTAMSVDELLASKSVQEKAEFFQQCRKISPDGIVCLMPTGMLLRQMVASYSQQPDRFDWRKINVRIKEYEDALSRFEDFLLDEKLAEEQRGFAKQTSATFEKWFRNLRPQLQTIYRVAGEQPHAYHDVLKYSLEDGGVFWGFAKELYRVAQEWRASPDGPSRPEGIERISLPDDETIKTFVNSCPPFRCVVTAFILTWYDRSVRGTHAQPRFEAGRVDQFMSAYLPYFPQFITHDEPQQRCLQEVVRACGLSTQVRPYEDFYNGFMVFGTSVIAS